jgi:hypothetical protein
MAGKVLGRGNDIGLAVGGDEGARERRHGLWVCAEASLAPRDDRIAGIGVEIHHRPEIEIDPRLRKLLRHAPIEAKRGIWGSELRIAQRSAPRRNRRSLSAG